MDHELHPRETDRITALHALGILDSDRENVFDSIVALAGEICETPIANITFIDERRQWLKASTLIEISEVPREDTFCTHTIRESDLLIVPDTALDPRFADNPYVVGEPGIRAYIGAPLVDKDGLQLGTLCAMHMEPKYHTTRQIDEMRHLGHITSAILVSRQIAQEQTAAERELTEWLSLSSQMAQIGHWTLGIEDRKVRWSDAVADLHCQTKMPQRFGIRALLEIYHPDDRPLMRDALEDALDNHRSSDQEARIVCGPEREVRVIHNRILCQWDDEGSPSEIFVISQDITRLRQSEAALMRSEERFTMAALGSSVGIYDCSDLDSGEVYWSPHHYKLLGYEPGEIPSSRETYYSLLHPDDTPRFRHAMQQLMLTRLPIRGEYRLKHKTKGYRWFLITGTAVWDKAGKPRRLSGSLMDINDLKRAEETAQRAQRMEAVGQLTGGIAHDFNNLLAVMMGSLELLQDDPDHPDRDQFIASAMRSVQRGAQLTSQLLAFGRRTLLKPTVLPINHVIEDMDGILRRTFPETIRLELHLTEPLNNVVLDRSQFENAILNLAINARDAMPQGGTLGIKTDEAFLDESCALTEDEGLRPGHYVTVSVSDNGSGIPSRLIDKVFDPFFTTKNTGEGSGLGLSMVHGFVKQSGGAIRISSSEGEGTTVKLYFRTTQANTEPAPTDPGPAPVAGNCERILVVEDEDDVRSIVVSQLISLGYSVHAAINGEEAVRMLESSARFDLLLTDIVMPGKFQGPDVARVARGIDPEYRIIFMSGYPDHASVQSSSMRRGDVHLLKPVSRAELARALSRMLHPKSGEPGRT